MSVTFESGQDILCLETWEEGKKIQLKKKVKNKFFSSCHSFIFELYTLISPNLLIILKKKLHIQVDLKEAPQS